MDVHPDTVLQSIEPEHAPRPAAARRTFKERITAVGQRINSAFVALYNTLHYMFIGSCIHEYRGPVQANYPRGTQLFYAGYRAGPYEMIKSNVIWERVYMSFVVLLFILVGVLLSLSEARECCKCS